MDISKTNLIVLLYSFVCKKKLRYFIPAVFLISILLLGLPSFLLGTMFHNTRQQGFIEDFGVVFGLGVFGLPFLAIFTVYFVNNIPRIITRIRQDSSIEMPEADFEEIQSRFCKRVTRKINNLIILPAFLLNGIWVTIHLSNPTLSWFTTYNSSGKEVFMVNGYLYVLVDTLFFYLLCYVSIYFISIILFLKDLAEKAKIRVIPLHPDGCGGLADIGKLGFINSLPILVLGFGIVSILINDTYFMKMPILSFYHIFVIAFYLIVSPLFFFLPLYYFNKPMKKEKRDTLNKLGVLYKQIFNDTFKETDLNNSSIERLEKLDFVKNSFEQVKRMPIWPFNVESIKRFFLVIVSPFTAFVIPVIIERIIASFFK